MPCHGRGRSCDRMLRRAFLGCLRGAESRQSARWRHFPGHRMSGAPGRERRSESAASLPPAAAPGWSTRRPRAASRSGRSGCAEGQASVSPPRRQRAEPVVLPPSPSGPSTATPRRFPSSRSSKRERSSSAVSRWPAARDAPMTCICIATQIFSSGLPGTHRLRPPARRRPEGLARRARPPLVHRQRARRALDAQWDAMTAAVLARS
jgi:hypothetical protein